MALIPQDPKQQRWLVAAVVALGLAYAFTSFWYSDRRAEVTAMQDRLERLEQQNRNAQITAARGGKDLEERMALYQRHVMSLEALIPAQEEVPALLRDITSEARHVNVDLDTFNPEPDEPGQYYTKESYQLRAVGEYHDVGRFLTSIASLPRIITPVDLDVAPFTDPQNVTNYDAPVVASFRIETYVLPAKGDQPPPADVGSGG